MKPAPWHNNWSAVDDTADPQFFVRFLDATRTQMIRRAHYDPKKYFAYLKLQSGDALLDIGCGTGEMLHPLTGLVGHQGRIVGADASQTIITEAKRRAVKTGSAAEFHQADAHDLPFPDQEFHRCTATSVFQHLNKPAQAVAEMVRVVKPGGFVTITEADWETQIVASDHYLLTRRLLNFFCDTIRNGQLARNLPAMLQTAGLQNVTVVALTSAITDGAETSQRWLRDNALFAAAAGTVTKEEAELWISEQEERIKSGRYLSSFTCFRVSGYKPLLDVPSKPSGD